MKASLLRFLSFLVVLIVPIAAWSETEPPRTVAETSDYKATSRYAEVVDFCEKLAKASPLVRVGELGKTVEKRTLPLLIIADPPVSTPEEAAKSGKIVVLAIGNIHAGEVDGKEGLLMLARDIALAKERPLLKDLVIVIAPIFNADGNEKISKEHRTDQNGPVEGVGVRTNADGFDLNRDFVKLESPEVRALTRAFTRWNPSVFIDCHTTNGSFHRYTITYEGPRCPAGDEKLVAFVRDEMFPDVGKRLQKYGGYRSFFYGTMTADHKMWETVPATPRYGIHDFGLRGGISVLVESYTYAPYRDRVLASRDFVRSILDYTVANKDKVKKLVAAARERTKAEPKESDTIVLRQKAVGGPRPVEILGFVEEKKDGKTVPTDKPHTYEVEYNGYTQPTLTVHRPFAYLIPAKWTKVVETLQRHGIELEELREDVELDVEAYCIDKVNRHAEFQKHPTVDVDVTARKDKQMVKAGTIVVKTTQTLGSLAAYLLEPQSEDGLTTWNFFDAALKEKTDFPVLRLPSATAPLLTTKIRPLAEERTLNKRITTDVLLGDRLRSMNFSGTPVVGQTWQDDGEHYRENRAGKLWQFDAVTGRVTLVPRHDPQKVAKALSELKELDPKMIPSIAGRVANIAVDSKRSGDLFTNKDDLYYFAFDGSQAVRLTKSAGVKNFSTLSPDGKIAAYVRAGNLCVADIATKWEWSLTDDGGDGIANGALDWVYAEELYTHGQPGYWWAPDSKHLAFLRFDDKPVNKFTVVDQVPPLQRVESNPYPRAGDPNPLVKLGIAAVAGGPVRWIDLSKYPPDDMLISRVGFLPDGQRIYFYVQDRTQTWLDVCTASVDGGAPTVLFRETTKAWVEDLGEPQFLKDGSFVLSSERSGWKHLYRFNKDGKLLNPITSGEWEARTVHRIDEDGGWVYFSGTKDAATGNNLYRVKIDGSSLERLTATAGTHTVNLSPKSNLFIDSVNDHATPTRVRLCRNDGNLVRTLDTNPVYSLEEYKLGKVDMVQIKCDDGFLLEGQVILPPDFDAAKKYPVWMEIYGGPHLPMVHDSWRGGHIHDQALASLGFVVVQVDPRGGSGKGAVSAWSGYKQLGVQELKDLETAVRWLTGKPFIDAARIGISGHSYGGFMTAYALTHSKLFAAGIAGAPVTDWRNYDTIYTERYMGTPKDNAKGYDATSVVKAARNLHGRLMILHGGIDDNVHPQNTMQLAQALQRADRDFEMMIYPESRHGLFGKHYQRLTIDFMKRTLQP